MEIKLLNSPSNHAGILFDRAFVAGRSNWVIGIDEVGRGCLAGPVVAVAYCVRLDFADSVPQVRDSKQLSPISREHISTLLEAISFSKIGIGSCSVDEIDFLNIGKASLLAMERALKQIDIIEDKACLLVDGRFLPEISCPMAFSDYKAVIKGDECSWVIGAASILAKVKRDAMMVKLDFIFPGYDFANNKGYGTKNHLCALKRLGPTTEHRRSFRPVQDCVFTSS